MVRHSYYLGLPWNLHSQTGLHRHHNHLWWLIAAITLMAMFLIGVGVTGGSL